MTSRCSFQTKMFQDWGHYLTYIYSLLVFSSKYCSLSLNIYYYVNQGTTPPPISFYKTLFGVWLKIHGISGILKLCLTGLNEIISLKGDPRSIFLLWSLVLGYSCQSGAWHQVSDVYLFLHPLQGFTKLPLHQPFLRLKASGPSQPSSCHQNKT